MNVLLTGATGGLGYRTIEKLILNQNIECLIASGRTIRPALYVDNPKVKYELGALENLDFSQKLVDSADSIIHAAALSSPWGHYEEFENANVISMKNLLTAAKKKRIKRFVYISTPSVYVNFKNRFNVKESDLLPQKFVNAYAKTKFEAELLLKESEIPYIILRPRALIGRGDSVIMPRLIRAFKEGTLKIIGDGNNVVDLTSLSNVADAIELSLFIGSNAINQTYNITNGEPVKMWECVETVLSKLGYTWNKQKIPFAVANFAAKLMELKSRLTNFKEPALTVYSVNTLAKSFTLDISKARNLLGYSPKMTTEEAIVEFVNWNKENEKS